MICAGKCSRVALTLFRLVNEERARRLLVAKYLEGEENTYDTQDSDF